MEVEVILTVYLQFCVYLSPYLTPNNHATLCKHQVFDGTENTCTKDEEIFQGCIEDPYPLIRFQQQCQHDYSWWYELKNMYLL